MNNMRRCRVSLGFVVVDPSRSQGDFLQCRGQPKGLTADLRSGFVGGVFPRPADCHLHQRRENGSKEHHQEGADQPEPFPGSAEEKREIGHHRNCTGKSRGDSHVRCVVISDVGQLVGDHAGQFLPREAAQEARGHSDRRVRGVATGGKGIWLQRVDQINLGLG